MFSYKHIFLLVLSAALLMPSTLTEPKKSEAVEVPNLKQTLQSGLKARLPREFQFIERVVLFVENDKLSLKIVMSTFKWARLQDERIPFIYFENALKKRAKAIGVDL